MLQIRATPVRALRRRQDVLPTKILPLVHQRNLAVPRKKASLASTTKNLARVSDFKQVRKAFIAAVSQAEIKACKNDNQRRNLLWSKRTQIETSLPAKTFESSYGIGRRLWEKGVLFDLPRGQDLKDVLFADHGSMLMQMESDLPLWIQSEVKEMQVKDTETEQKLKESLVNSPTIDIDPQIAAMSDAAKIVEDAFSEPSSEPNGKTEQTDPAPADKKNQLLDDEADAAGGLFQYPKIAARKPLPENGNNSGSSEIPIGSNKSQISEKPENSENLKSSEKDDLTDKESLVEEIPPSMRRKIEDGYAFEDIAMRIMKHMTIDEPPELVQKMEKLKDLSKVLREEDIRPDMKPVTYPSQASYAVLTEATALLEEAAFNYVARTMPTVVTWPSFDSPEAQEYKKWISLINRLSRHFQRSGTKTHVLPDKFIELSTYGDVIRNAAAHRVQINAPKMNKLLAHAKQWVDILDVPDTAAKFERLQERAAAMQSEMEEAIKPVSEEVMGSLDKIKVRWGAVKRFEQQILDIQQKITQEKSAILTEEDGIKETLKKGQAVRVSHGKAFSRDELRKYIYIAPVPSQEIPEPAADTTSDLPTEQTVDAIKSPDAATPVATHEISPPRISFGKLKKKTIIELSASEAQDMLAVEDASFTEADRRKLYRDRVGGLVSFSKDTLATIPESGSENEANEIASDVTTARKAPSSETENPKDELEKPSLTKESDPEAPKKSGSTWYNPLSWFR
ncbi:hypothetical protein ABW21_db0205513 [Orbilia brochopaga]|nr:hypothetical protein ABW21_db0205513 [Drechslerella brochopaga]